MFYLKMHMNVVCVCTCICVHSLHGQNKELCSVMFCSCLFVSATMYPAPHFLFCLFLALAADHSVIGKHHCPWSFLSDLIRHPIHRHCKQTIKKGSYPILDAAPPSLRTPPSLLPHTSPLLYSHHTYIVPFRRNCLPIQTFSCNTSTLILAPCNKLSPGPQTHNVAPSDHLYTSPH